MQTADLRYSWALLKVFNKYMSTTVPFIDNMNTIADLPKDAIPLTLSAYMSYTRNLCLSSVKSELRHLILEKTTVQRDNIPKL